MSLLKHFIYQAVSTKLQLFLSAASFTGVDGLVCYCMTDLCKAAANTMHENTCFLVNAFHNCIPMMCKSKSGLGLESDVYRKWI